jgi:hypothetical protein
VELARDPRPLELDSPTRIVGTAKLGFVGTPSVALRGRLALVERPAPEPRDHREDPRSEDIDDRC